MRVYATRCEREDNVLYEMDKLRIQLMKIRVCGIDSVSRAIIVAKSDGEKSEEEKRSSTPCQKLLIEGTALQAVMGIEGIKGTDAKSTHVMEVEKCLGIVKYQKGSTAEAWKEVKYLCFDAPSEEHETTCIQPSTSSARRSHCGGKWRG